MVQKIFYQPSQVFKGHLALISHHGGIYYCNYKFEAKSESRLKHPWEIYIFMIQLGYHTFIWHDNIQYHTAKVV